MFQIKVCGITSLSDARLVAEAGADAIGLNFHRGSPRYLDPHETQAIVGDLPPRMIKVGVFVNATASEIQDAAERWQLDLIQLHGDEPPDILANLNGLPVVRAFRCGAMGMKPVADYLDECRRLECLPRMVLFDALTQAAYGGTGHLADWQLARQYHDLAAGPMLVLAGGLTADNVGCAISAVGPAAVDAASGVESSPGRKDPAKVAAFVKAAQAAFGGPGKIR